MSLIATSSTPAILPGLDSLLSGQATARLHWLCAQRVGLLTNHTGRARDGLPTLEALRALGIQVSALFAPEHGPTGTREGNIESGHTEDGLPIYSLYGETHRPTAAMLEGLDAIIYDIQDVGARFYTYSTTLALVMEECARHGVAVVVLDRPNPIGGAVVEGPGIHDDCRSFVGHMDVPVRHGMTLGELARLHQTDAQLDLDLQIVPVANWQRSIYWPDTGLTWVAPSPNLPDYTSAAWYPGLCLLEFSGVAVGRGTEAPFQIIGAPWFDADRVLAAMHSWLTNLGIAGEATEFTPTRAIYEGEKCRGLRFRMATGSSNTPPCIVPLGLCLLATLHQAHPEEFNAEKLQRSRRLVGSPPVLEALVANDIPGALSMAEADAGEFAARRKPFLLY